MIRVITPAPVGWNGLDLPTPPAGAISVNVTMVGEVIDPQTGRITTPGVPYFAAYWNDGDARALTAQQWATAATPVANPIPANTAAIQAKALQALAVNDTFLALASPTNAQTTAQVKALTRECSALIRLVLGQLDTTTGT